MSPRDDRRLANIAPTLELALVSPQVEHDADVPPSALNASSAVARSAASSAPLLDPPAPLSPIPHTMPAALACVASLPLLRNSRPYSDRCACLRAVHAGEIDALMPPSDREKRAPHDEEHRHLGGADEKGRLNHDACVSPHGRTHMPIGPALRTRPRSTHRMLVIMFGNQYSNRGDGSCAVRVRLADRSWAQEAARASQRRREVRLAGHPSTAHGTRSVCRSADRPVQRDLPPH